MTDPRQRRCLPEVRERAVRLVQRHQGDHALEWAAIEPSVGCVCDSYDNALAEIINGLYKAEVIHRRGPWRNFDAVEFATLEWVAWFNHRRLLEPIGNIPPAQPKPATMPRWNSQRWLRDPNQTASGKTRAVQLAAPGTELAPSLIHGSLIA